MTTDLAARVASITEELGVYARGINDFKWTAEKTIALVSDLMAEVERLRGSNIALSADIVKDYICLEDGSYYYMPPAGAGAYQSWLLRRIATQLDELNARTALAGKDGGA